MDKEYRVGDMVLVGSNPYKRELNGLSGAIVDSTPIMDNGEQWWGIQFEGWRGGHSCDGHGKVDQCYRLPGRCFTRIEVNIWD